MDFANSLEEWFISQLALYFGLPNAIRIEDSLMILCTLLLGYILGKIRVTYLFKSNYYYNEKLKNLVFQRNEYNGIIDYSFKIPKTLVERIEFLYAIKLANRNESKLSIAKAKSYSRLALLFLMAVILFAVCIISFMLNVVDM
ncbi:hypothetical protein BSK59_15750 [Paenibacillus odorifer]|uniref:hypothetical protein n=1 Tax=Paenibacillus odorifer TaxID=189426 RepID=UPI00096E9044|nr:hypothetical protein [Paenibacillus odorifer]OME54034.1 hypothetical protein BSK59_15750 [Paenibacillus odorifer]